MAAREVLCVPDLLEEGLPFQGLKVKAAQPYSKILSLILIANTNKNNYNNIKDNRYYFEFITKHYKHSG